MGRPIRFPDPTTDRCRVANNPTCRRILDALLADRLLGLKTPQIKARLGIASVRFLRRMLGDLEDVGLVEVDRCDPPCGRGRANTYRLAGDAR